MIGPLAAFDTAAASSRSVPLVAKRQAGTGASGLMISSSLMSAQS
jgi:hypothetical protein